ncbi:MAG: DUF5320 domain-containing protein [Phycisphaerales bacterium]
MPRGDGTGPAGMGPMTGRAAGYCAGYGMPGFMNPIGGRGFGGRGRGGGRGRRNWYHATGLPGWARAGYGYPAWGGFMGPNAPYATPPAVTFTAEQELEGLRQQAEYFQNALEEINKRIDQLAAESKKKK